eukprot:3427213-Rhodomonas_salina.2
MPGYFLRDLTASSQTVAIRKKNTKFSSNYYQLRLEIGLQIVLHMCRRFLPERVQPLKNCGVFWRLGEGNEQRYELSVARHGCAFDAGGADTGCPKRRS